MMLIFAALLAGVGVVAFCGASWKARETSRDETRMSSYITSLKAVAAEHCNRIADLERSVIGRDQRIAAQERLLEGQATHLRTLDPRYVG